MNKRFTGFKDAKGQRIFDGDILETGMRRDDPKGWTTEKVVWGNLDKEWLLEDLKTGEKMQMQYDKRLRFLKGEGDAN